MVTYSFHNVYVLYWFSPQELHAALTKHIYADAGNMLNSKSNKLQKIM